MKIRLYRSSVNTIIHKNRNEALFSNSTVYNRRKKMTFLLPDLSPLTQSSWLYRLCALVEGLNFWLPRASSSPLKSVAMHPKYHYVKEML